jgi:hypothetical protein
MAGLVADLATQLIGNATSGYLVVFGLEAFMLFLAAIMLYRMMSAHFKNRRMSLPL